MRRWTAPVLVLFVFMGLFGMGVWHLRQNWLTPQEWAQVLEKELSHLLGLPVRLEVASVGWTGVTVRNLRVQPDRRSPTGYFLTVPELRLKWSWRDLARPSSWRQLLQAQAEQVLHQVALTNATVFLWRDRAGEWNVPFVGARPQGRRPVRLPLVRIHNGTFILGDETLPLSDGLPFQLRLTAVDGFVQPVEQGTQMQLTGQLGPPLGTGESRAQLSLIQVSVNEKAPEVHGRLVVSLMRLPALPQQWRAWNEWRLKSGELADIVLNWQQRDGEVELSGLATVRNAVVLSPKAVFSPLQAAIQFVVSLEEKRWLSGQVTVRTLKPHPQLGSGMLSAEWIRRFWRVRWRGERFPIDSLRLFVAEPVPLQGGTLSGAFWLEAQGKRWRLGAELMARQIHWHPPKEWQTDWRLPSITFATLHTSAQLERRDEGRGARDEEQGTRNKERETKDGSNWRGTLMLSAQSSVGQWAVTAWLNGQRGKLQAKVQNLPLLTFQPTWQLLLPERWREELRLQRGFGSGSFVVSWRGRRWQLEELKGHLHEVALDNRYLPDARLSAQVQSDGRFLQLSSVKVRVGSDAIAQFSGQTEISRQPLWEVQGRLDPKATVSIGRWLTHHLSIPTYLLGSGVLTIQGGGVGEHWQAQVVWDSPALLLAPMGIRWHLTARRSSLLIAPSGGAAVLNAVAVRPTAPRVVLGETEIRLPNGLQLTGWRMVWDTQQRWVTAYGVVEVPQGQWSTIPLRNGHAEVVWRLAFRKQPEWELQLRRLAVETPHGTLKGNLFWQQTANQTTLLKAQLNVQDGDLAGWQQQLVPTLQDDWNMGGRFNGQVSLQLVDQRSLQLALEGELTDWCLHTDKGDLQAKKVNLPAFSLAAHRSGEQWVWDRVAGELQGNQTLLRRFNQTWMTSFWHLQGVAEQLDGDWRWDVRLPRLNAFGGEVAGQGQGTAQSATGFLQFANCDIAQLLQTLEPGRKVEAKGSVSGWLRWSANRKDEQWQGEWEGALLAAKSGWREWGIHMAGARAHGAWSWRSGQSLPVLTGEVEGLHLLSEEGQAVLSGHFAVRNGQPELQLQGRWVGISLQRLSQRFDLPIALRGVSEGTLQVRWDGRWHLQGTATAQAVRVGNRTLWRQVSGEWEWQEQVVHFRSLRARWGQGEWFAEGNLTLSPKPLASLTVKAQSVAAAELSQLLQEWQLPFSDWEWLGQLNGTVHLFWSHQRRKWLVVAESPELRLGRTLLGSARLDLQVDQRIAEDQTATAIKGQVTFQQNGARVGVAWEGDLPNWQVAWQAGRVPLATVRSLAYEWFTKTPAPQTKGWKRWLELPIAGEVWTNGQASGQHGQLLALDADLRSTTLRGLGDRPTQLTLRVQRADKRWFIQLAELQQGEAKGEGRVTLTDGGELSGTLTVTRVSSELVLSALTLLGVPVDDWFIPEGNITARLQLAGTTEKPVLEGVIRADGIRWRGWTIRQVVVRRFLIRNNVLHVEKGDGMIRWQSDKAVASFWGTVELNGQRRWGWQLEVPPTPLQEILPANLPLQVEQGWGSGWLRVEGTTGEPKVQGMLEIAADALGIAPVARKSPALASLTTWRNVRCLLVAEGNKVRMSQLTANWSGGTVTGEGWLQLGKGGLQNLLANQGEGVLRVRGFQTQWQATPVHIHEAILRARLDADGMHLQVEKWQGNGITVSGGVRWTSLPADQWAWLADGQWNLSLQLDEFRWQIRGGRGELSGSVALRTEEGAKVPVLTGELRLHDGDLLRLPAMAAGGNAKWELPPAVRLALTLTVGNQFFLRNPQASLLLDGELSLQGDLARPRLEGELRSRRGTLRLPAAVLSITDMGLRLAYALDPLTRQWVGTARLRIEGETMLDIHRVLFTISGPVDEQSQRLGILPSVSLLAIPPLPEQTALERMFGLGLAQLGEALTNWQQLFSGAFVQSFMGNLLAPVTEPIAQALRWTELSVVREQTTRRQWLRLGIPLSPRLHILWRQGFSPADPSALEVQYYLGKRTSVTVIKRERERAEIRVQTSVRF